MTEAFLADKNPDKINLGVVNQGCLKSGSACCSGCRAACSTPTRQTCGCMACCFIPCTGQHGSARQGEPAVVACCDRISALCRQLDLVLPCSFENLQQARPLHVGSLQGQQREASCAELCARSRTSRVRAQFHGVSFAVDYCVSYAPASRTRQSRATAVACFLPSPACGSNCPAANHVAACHMPPLQRQQGSLLGQLMHARPLQRKACSSL